MKILPPVSAKTAQTVILITAILAAYEIVVSPAINRARA